MRPSCSFCGKSCFASLPKGTPFHIMSAYEPVTLAATCMEGRAFEKTRIGYNYDDIREFLEKRSKEPSKTELFKLGQEVEEWLKDPSKLAGVKPGSGVKPD